MPAPKPAGHPKPCAPDPKGEAALVDDYRSLMKLASDTVAATLHSGRRLSRYGADDGVVTGWRVRHGRPYHEERRYSNAVSVWKKEWWGTSGEIILTRTGELYEFSVATEEGGNPAVRKQTRTLRKLGPHDLVGTTGAPFSEITRELRMLPVVSHREARARGRRGRRLLVAG
jgi:hypothetical protein